MLSKASSTELSYILVDGGVSSKITSLKDFSFGSLETREGFVLFVIF